MNFWYTKPARTDAEYQKMIQFQKKIDVLVVVTGILTFFIVYMIPKVVDFSMNENISGLYSGLGIGLVFAGIGKYLQHTSWLKNEQSIKAARLKNNDERIVEIGRKAYQMSATLLLIALYFLGLIGGFFEPILILVMGGLVWLFLLSYCVAFFIYSKKM